MQVLYGKPDNIAQIRAKRAKFVWKTRQIVIVLFRFPASIPIQALYCCKKAPGPGASFASQYRR